MVLFFAGSGCLVNWQSSEGGGAALLWCAGLGWTDWTHRLVDKTPFTTPNCEL